MEDLWNVVKGTGWITIPEFGEINPRRDNVAGGRQYFTAKVDNGDFARVTGEFIDGGPETWHFDFDRPFWLADGSGRCVEVQVSLLAGGRYAVKYRPGAWPGGSTGGW